MSRDRALRMLRQGRTVCEVARNLGVPHTTVSRWKREAGPLSNRDWHVLAASASGEETIYTITDDMGWSLTSTKASCTKLRRLGFLAMSPRGGPANRVIRVTEKGRKALRNRLGR